VTDAAPVARRSDTKRVWRRWAILAAYTTAIYATLPIGPQAGRALLRTGLGSWLLGGGAAVVALAGGVVILIVLVRRGAPRRAYLAMAAAAVGSWGGLAWLRAQHLERIHLPEYAVTAWLAWWALVPTISGEALGYAAAAGLAAAIGWGEELLQAVVPGRVYDPRDVAANALGALLGVLVVVAVRSGRR
jgi:hypothetical protein